jgi:hypothetical protein
MNYQEILQAVNPFLPLEFVNFDAAKESPHPLSYAGNASANP